MSVICANAVLPPTNFNFCAPKVRFGNIKRLWTTRASSADVLADWEDLAEWTTRINATAVIPVSGAAPIRALTITGDLPEPTRTETEISDDRIVYGPYTNVLNFTVDDLSLENIEWARLYQDDTYIIKMWYGWSTLIAGSTAGIDATIRTALVIPRGKSEVTGINGVLTWTGIQAEVANSPFV